MPKKKRSLWVRRKKGKHLNTGREAQKHLSSEDVKVNNGNEEFKDRPENNLDVPLEIKEEPAESEDILPNLPDEFILPGDIPLEFKEDSDNAPLQDIPYMTTPLDAQITEKTFTLFNALLPPHWRVMQSQDGFQVIYLSRSPDNPAIQRSVCAPMRGVLKLFVHCRPLPKEVEAEIFKDIDTNVSLYDEPPEIFVDKTFKLVNAVRHYKVCSGVNDKSYEDLWHSDTSGVVDWNPYNEARYDRTFRTHGCSILVPVRKRKCIECCKGTGRLASRLKTRKDGSLNPHTTNKHLTDKEKLIKLESQRKELCNLRKKIDYLEKQLAAMKKTDQTDDETDEMDDSLSN